MSGGFVIELSNNFGVEKAPCDVMRLDPIGGTAKVVLQILEAATGAQEWISGAVHAGPVLLGSTMTVLVAPGNTSFWSFSPTAASVLKSDDGGARIVLYGRR